MVDTSVIFSALKNPRLLETINSFFTPCISEVVESELEHLVFKEGIDLSRFLNIWTGTRTVRCNRIKQGYREFTKSLPVDLQAELACHLNDSLIGYAAYAHGMNIIISNNKRDFRVWEGFNVRVITYHEFLQEYVSRSRKKRGAMIHNQEAKAEACLA